MQDCLQSEFDNLVAWSDSVGLPINFSKSVVMDIITKRDHCLNPIYVADVGVLRNVSSFTYLVVIFRIIFRGTRILSLL